METIDQDQGVKVARERAQESRQALQEAEAAHAALAPQIGMQPLDLLDLAEARRAVTRARTAHEEAKRIVEAATTIARTRAHLARRPALKALDGEIAKAARALLGLITARVAYAAETSTMTGQRDPEDGGSPLAFFLTRESAISATEQMWQPRPARRPEPVPDGHVRVRVTEGFLDRDALSKWRGPGEVVALTKDAAKDALAKGFVVAV